MKSSFLLTQRQQEENQEVIETAIELFKIGKAKLKEIPTETIVTTVTAGVLTIGLGILFVKAVKNYTPPKPEKVFIINDDDDFWWLYD